MQELDIQILCANTPQAKGRVERANQTLQDRLVKELRLKDIADIDSANAYLPEFIQDFNRRFAVVPRSNHDAHRPLLSTEDLDRILSWQETRMITKNLTVHFNNVIYQIQSQRPSYALRKAKVTICENAQGDITILYNHKPLGFTPFRKPIASLNWSIPKPWITNSRRPTDQLMTTPGDSMARNSIPLLFLARIDSDGLFAFSAFLTTGRAQKRAEQFPLCPAVSSLVWRSGRTPALPYPPAKPFQFSIYLSLPNRTFLLCIDSRWVKFSDVCVTIDDFFGGIWIFYFCEIY